MLATKLNYYETDRESNPICSECGEPILPNEVSVGVWGSPVHDSCADYLDARIEEEMMNRDRRRL